MDILEKIKESLPTSVTETNVAATSRTALVTLKELQNDENWNQNTADASGSAAVAYADIWTTLFIPALQEQIDAAKAEAKRLHDLADEEANAASEEAEKNTVHNLTHGQAINSRSVDYQVNEKWCKKHRAEAYKWDEKVDELNEKKHKIEKEIETFLLGIYDLKLMNESIVFLKQLKDSNVTLTEDTRRNLFGRLSLIENMYRKQFEQFEKTISDTNSKYTERLFYADENGLNYFAKREVVVEKLKEIIKIELISSNTSNAKLSYICEKKFNIPKKKVDGAKTAITALCKNFVLDVKKSTFAIKLDREFENDEIADEISALNTNSDSCAAELSGIMTAVLANGGKVTLWQKLGAWFKNRKAEKTEKALKEASKVSNKDKN